jgi:predicted MPP superfamily phosphohydrolase
VDSDRPARNYGRLLRMWEQVQALMMPTGWPATLAERCGVSTEVALDQQEVLIAAHLGGALSLRVGFASDFHAGPMTSARVLDRAAATLADAAPDVLLLGGDFVSLRPHYVTRVAERLGAIPAPAGRFAVLGNHDHWAGGPEVTRALERAGIEVLTNRNRRLPTPFEQVTVCGLDDHIAGYPDAAQAFAGAGPVRLLLMHAPSGLLDIGEHPFTVAFAGHTHGGQIAFRKGYPLYVPHGPLSRRYHGGRFQLQSGRVLLVSRGVGCSSVPFRWNVPPEVHLWSLQGSDSQ